MRVRRYNNLNAGNVRALNNLMTGPSRASLLLKEASKPKNVAEVLNAVAMRSLFSTRKPRSNKGVKRGPRVAPIIGPSNVILVNVTGTGHVKKARKVRSNKGRSRPTKTPEAAVRNFFAMVERKPRKTRKNKGIKRGPRSHALRFNNVSNRSFGNFTSVANNGSITDNLRG